MPAGIMSTESRPAMGCQEVSSAAHLRAQLCRALQGARPEAGSPAECQVGRAGGGAAGGRTLSMSRKPRSSTSSGLMSYSFATHTAAVLRTYGSSSCSNGSQLRRTHASALEHGAPLATCSLMASAAECPSSAHARQCPGLAFCALPTRMHAGLLTACALSHLLETNPSTLARKPGALAQLASSAVRAMTPRPTTTDLASPAGESRARRPP